MIFIEKKSLPRVVISGIPRARAETTILLSTSNCIGFGDVQRGRTCPGLGAGQLGGRQSKRLGHERCSSGDHGEDSAGDL